MKKLFALATVAVLASTSIASAQAVQPLDTTVSTQTLPIPLIVLGIGGLFAIAGSSSGSD
ncbi:hypothetical protein [Shimia ponticola]|uniref:hypothetical protein n=1 Tax=Shimia ponticola TaxID=2582893 RepID=UPI0011BDBF5D|nr:hypothetical protein [Shimia ponticola]